MDDDISKHIAEKQSLAQIFSTKLLWGWRTSVVLAVAAVFVFSYLFYQSSHLSRLQAQLEQLHTQSVHLHQQAVTNRFEKVDNPSAQSMPFRQSLLQLSDQNVGNATQASLDQLKLQGGQYAEMLDQALMSQDSFANIVDALVTAEQQAAHHPVLHELFQAFSMNVIQLLGAANTDHQAVMGALNQSLAAIDDAQQSLTPALQLQAQHTMKSVLPLLSRYVQFQQALGNINQAPFEQSYQQAQNNLHQERNQLTVWQAVLGIVFVVCFAFNLWLVQFYKVRQLVPLDKEEHAAKEQHGDKEDQVTDADTSGQVLSTAPTVKASSPANVNVAPATSDTSTTDISSTESAPSSAEVQPPAQVSTSVSSSKTASPMEEEVSSAVSHAQPQITEVNEDVNAVASATMETEHTSTELFDARHILSNMDDDLDSVIMLLEIFVQEHSADGEHFREALEQGRLEDAARIAHSLKGVASSIGSAALKQVSERLELALKQDDMIVEQDYTELNVTLRLVVAQVQDYLVAQGAKQEVVSSPQQIESNEDEEKKPESFSHLNPNSDPDSGLTNESSSDSRSDVTLEAEIPEEAGSTVKLQDREAPAIDIAYMMKTMDGDLETVQMLLEIFVEEHVNDGKRLTQLVYQTDPVPEEAIRLVHSIKGVSSSVGAQNLKAIAANIESRMKQGQTVSDADYREFDIRLSAAIDAANHFLATADSTADLELHEEGVA
ncbi:hypothetical protein A3K86_13645 [Photobacterium jeanii]|uniref:HPt domain-containing protein n=1 Tax=Photobacterium jeanii TaxID=858640 RepID=A0A178K8G6_9GAMM|nr:Hpt domain-containing protein [Photobacterium jeanii]OAN13618.1 hypothetical protein A3K86_13645 [Photobacterium jeanii]PST88736.1 Hpt domain-containing protein [Photobacterium jeanii]